MTATTTASTETNGSNGHAHIAGFDFGSPPPLGNPYMGGAFGVPPPTAQDPPMVNYRGSTLGQPFNLRERLKVKTPFIGYSMMLPSTDMARMVGALGYDWVFIDWEHNPMGISEIRELIKWVQYSSEGRTAAVVRVPNFDHHTIAWVLDSGASGIIVPHTETAEQARAVVNAARFPPHGGKRSFPPAAVYWGVNDGCPPGQTPFDMFNGAAVVMQIESGLGAENAAEIASVPGVDAIMIGNGDLRLDIGLPPGLDGEEPAYTEAVDKIINAAKKNDKSLWTFTNGPDSVAKRISQGFLGLMSGADSFGLPVVGRMNLAQTHEAARSGNK